VPESDEFSGGKLNIRRIEKSPKALDEKAFRKPM